MNNSELQDLQMAGVLWELDDTPMVLRNAENITSTPDVQPNAPQLSRTQTSIVPPIAPTHQMSPDTAAAMAARPTDINSLQRMIAEFCHPLRSGATNVVLAHIAPEPNGMVIITDVPGADDDASGRILSGATGELLDKMLNAIGMSRENVSLVPLVFWRTPGGRTPTRHELDLARPFVNRILEFLNPQLILTLGAVAASEIGNISLPHGHGVAITHTSGAHLIPIFHPNYLILKPAAKRDVWNALQSAQNLLKNADE